MGGAWFPSRVDFEFKPVQNDSWNCFAFLCRLQSKTKISLSLRQLVELSHWMVPCAGLVDLTAKWH